MKNLVKVLKCPECGGNPENYVSDIYCPLCGYVYGSTIDADGNKLEETYE